MKTQAMRSHVLRKMGSLYGTILENLALLDTNSISMIRLTSLIVGLAFIGLNSFAQRTIKEEHKLKFDDVLNLIEDKYVDSPDYDMLVDEAIVGLVTELDPHSEYMTAEEYKKMSEPLSGNFEGIGVQFNILKDTIAVVSPISGGPSERLGIRSGDKIVEIEDTVVAGIGITNR
ncbi:MAG: S41 family peptidase, partial [Flavobacteriales bacterium]